MHVRCKFRVRSIERVLQSFYSEEKKGYVSGEARTVKFDVSYDPAFHASTPSGVVELTLIHEEHARHFRLGAEYYADFTPVEPVVVEG